MNASSLRRLTGMLISSAASESSRSACHARPVQREPGPRGTAPRFEGHGDQAKVEVTLERVDLETEDRERIESRYTVWAASDVGRRRQAEEADAAAVRRYDDESLQEEERDDHQVVAEEPPRRQTQQEAHERRPRDDERYRELGLPVNSEVVGRKQRVAVRPDSEEGDEAEVKQSRPSRRRR